MLAPDGRCRVASTVEGHTAVVWIDDAGRGIAEPTRTSVLKRLSRAEWRGTWKGGGLKRSLIAAVVRPDGVGLRFGDDRPG